VTAAGVTLFVPMSVVGGSSNNVYGIDNDLGYVVWQRQFDAPLGATNAGCSGGLTSPATRIVRADGFLPTPFGGFGAGRGAVGYRSLLGEPGEGVPAEGRAGGGGRTGDPSGVPPAARGANPGAQGRGAAAAPPVPAARGNQAADRIPGTPRMEEAGGNFGFLFRPSGVAYVVSSDGMLHVVGLPSGKDMQKPAQFVPAHSGWSAPVAIGTTMYTATSGKCGGAPSAVWAIDLDSDAKPVVSWKTNGGPVAGAVAFMQDGTLVAAIGAGKPTGDGKASAIVALDAKTLQLKDWFTQPDADFVTGPTIIRHEGKEIVAAATRDGRVVLLDGASLGGANHSTPLFISKQVLGTGATVGADALAAWLEPGAPPAAAGAQPAPPTGAPWILVPVAGRTATDASSSNGAVTNGAVVALKLTGGAGALSLAPGWVSHDLASPSTPLVVNGVVFALATGVPATPAGKSGAAVLHAYDGVSGKRLWESGKAMSTAASPGSFWSGLGQVYVGARDGTLYAFGFNDERRAITTPGTK
jgi:outer membrane protein assembly factor BamB